MWWVVFLLLLKIFSLSLAPSNLMCLGVVFFVFILFRIHLVSLVWKLQFFTKFGKCLPFIKVFFLSLSLSPLLEIQLHTYWVQLLEAFFIFLLSVLWAHYFLLIFFPLTDASGISYPLLSKIHWNFIFVIVLSALKSPFGSLLECPFPHWDFLLLTHF